MAERVGDLAGVRCLVTGAGGFIGRAVVELLKREGAIVTGFGRAARDRELDPEVQWMTGPFEDPLSLIEACHRQEVVIHLLNSSTPATATQQPAMDVTGNVVPSIHLLEAARAAGVRRFLFASSGGTVYGPNVATPIVEGAATNPISAYGISKLAIEKYVAMFEHIHGLGYRILRIANPYGPGQSSYRGQGLIAAMLHAAIRDQPVQIWGDGSVTRDYIYIDDVATAIRAAILHEGPERIFNVGSGVGRSVSAIFDDLQPVLGFVPKVEYRPGRAVDVPINVLDTSLLRQATGWVPEIAWMDGLMRTKDWLGTPEANLR